MSGYGVKEDRGCVRDMMGKVQTIVKIVLLEEVHFDFALSLSLSLQYAHTQKQPNDNNQPTDQTHKTHINKLIKGNKFSNNYA